MLSPLRLLKHKFLTIHPCPSIERSTGTLKAWTGNGSGSSGKPGYT